MEEQQPKTGKFGLNYGLILGGVLVAFGIMLYIQDAHTSQSLVPLIVLIVLIGILTFLGINAFKKANLGYLSLGQAIKIGILIALTASVLALLYDAILVYGIDPAAKGEIMDARLAKPLAEGKITAEEANVQKEQSVKFWFLGYPILMIAYTFIGLIFGLIGGLILKKAKPAY